MPQKKTKEEYIQEAREIHKNVFDYSLIKELPKRDVRVSIICPLHGVFEQSFHKHLSGDGCKKCSILENGRQRIEKAKQKFNQEANKIHNNKYDYSRSVYKSATDNIIIICPTHGQFEQTPNRHLSGGGCKKCANEKVKERFSIPWNIYKEQLEKIHNNRYNYSKVEWKGVEEKIIVICDIHGEFIIRPQDHKDGRGCQICSKENFVQYNKYNTKIFIENAKLIWGEKYDYSKVNYDDSNTKIIIICNKHGEYLQLPQNHLKYGCGACGRELNKRNIELKEKSKIEFALKANKIHENSYDYSLIEYENAASKVNVICKNHGIFSITPNNHLRGRGCPECGKEASRLSRLKSFDEYHEEYKKIYIEKYDYSRVIWEGASKPISVICKKHGEFYVLPYLHKAGKECNRCSNQYSTISMEWLLFMEKRFRSEIQHARNFGEFVIPGTRYKADGYIKSLNTIFEFYGDYWHGNPKIYSKDEINSRIGLTYGELYNHTLSKSKLIIEKGFNLIEIWENDWKKFIKTIKILQNIWRSRNNN
jgi:hypothetical protein